MNKLCHLWIECLHWLAGSSSSENLIYALVALMRNWVANGVLLYLWLHLQRLMGPAGAQIACDSCLSASRVTSDIPFWPDGVLMYCSSVWFLPTRWGDECWGNCRRKACHWLILLEKWQVKILARWVPRTLPAPSCALPPPSSPAPQRP